MRILEPRARRLKIRVRKGWFNLFLPALSFKFVKKILGLGLKYSGMGREKHKEQGTKSLDSHGFDSWDKHVGDNDVDTQEILHELNYFIDELARLEPFVLVEVYDATENVYVKIETV